MKLFALLFMLLLGIGGTAFYHKQQEVVLQEENIIDVLENQELLDTTISSIVGNEIVTQEGQSYSIPVGTEVVTKLGNVTTFSRLSSGDQIQLLVEKETEDKSILKIWIVG